MILTQTRRGVLRNGTKKTLEEGTPRWHLQNWKPLLSWLTLVFDSEHWNDNSINWRASGRKPLLPKKNFDAHLQFAQGHVDKPEGCWMNVLWTDEPCYVMFDNAALHTVVVSWFGPEQEVDYTVQQHTQCFGMAEKNG